MGCHNSTPSKEETTMSTEIEEFKCTAQGSGILGDTHVQITGTEWTLLLDEPVEEGGKNQNANPMQFFISSLVACENEQAAVVAEELKIKIEKIEYEVSCDLDLGAFGGDNLDLTQPYVQGIVKATVTTDGTEEQVAALGASCDARCPIRRLLVNSGVVVKSAYAKAGGEPMASVDAGPEPTEPVERFHCTAQGSGILGDTNVQITGTEWKLLLDEPTEDGGNNKAPNPMQNFIAALTACENEQAAVIAGELKIKIEKIDWTVQVDLDLAGFEGKDLKLTQPFTATSINATVATDGTAEQVVSLAASLHARCPIRRLLINSGVDVKSNVTKA
eukprot:m.94896 g.94896  ORF g.94896 m.94896 type:complete len:332 (-) comp26765_c0_seq2:7-1002(-)